MKRIKIVIGVLFSMLFIFGFEDTKTAAKNEIPEILFISSYSYAFDTVPLQIKGIESVLEADTNLNYEFMDTKRFSGTENIEKFKSYLEFKCEKLTGGSHLLSKFYDGVLVGDDYGLEFVLDNNSNGELFYKIPVVFLAINNLELAKRAHQDPYISGICEDFSYKETLELAIKFNPKATKIFATVDQTSTGKGDKAQFELIQPHFENLGYECEIYDIGDHTFEESIERLNSIGSDTIFLSLSFFEDKNGDFMTMTQMCKFLVDNTNVPVYRASTGGHGQGIAGGVIVAMEEQGRLAAEMIKKYLSGTPMSEISIIEECPKEIIFDAKVLKKFNINLSLVPKNATLLNSEKTFYDKNKGVILVSISIIAFSLLICGGFFLDNYFRRKSNKELSQSVNHMKSLASCDPLTKLPNRRSLVTTINGLINANKKFAISVIDIDSFKEINDTYGHLFGDSVLIEVARRFNDMKQKNAIFTRFGGDEFIAILIAERFEEIDEMAQAVFNVFEDPFINEGVEFSINVSIGVAIYPNDAKSLDELLTRADDAMYEVKKESKNGIKYYSN